MRRQAWVLFSMTIGVTATAGCNLVLGLNDYSNECGGPLEAQSSCPDGGASGGGGQGGSSSTGGPNCHTASDCSSHSTACVIGSCDASHQCVTTNATVGTPCADHDGSVCDGQGECKECNKKQDCMPPDTACEEVTECTGHTCKKADAPQGTVCSDHGGSLCDGEGRCAGIAAIGTGSAHTCALTTLGRVQCWGFNNHGQLGDGTTADKHSPIDVVGLASGVAAITVGGDHACALMNSGGLKCWGSNEYGQLGDGTTSDRSSPVDGPAIVAGIATLGAGSNHTCAVTTTGDVECWGYNAQGQLGDATNTNRTSAVDVQGLLINLVAVAGGDDHTCALAAAGNVQCWGANSTGQLGDGTTSQHLSADVVHSLLNATAIAEGYSHSCALVATGGAKCWGLNQNGRLGDGTSTNRLTPVDVIGLPTGVRAIAGGAVSTCALNADGGALCWGQNGDGQLGDGTTTEHATAANVMGLTAGATQLSLRGRHACVLLSSGHAKCWGQNKYGQLGDGTIIQREAPVDVQGL